VSTSPSDGTTVGLAFLKSVSPGTSYTIEFVGIDLQ
jgi:hypothetical protein